MWFLSICWVEFGPYNQWLYGRFSLFLLSIFDVKTRLRFLTQHIYVSHWKHTCGWIGHTYVAEDIHIVGLYGIISFPSYRVWALAVQNWVYRMSGKTGMFDRWGRKAWSCSHIACKEINKEKVYPDSAYYFKLMGLKIFVLEITYKSVISIPEDTVHTKKDGFILIVHLS